MKHTLVVLPLVLAAACSSQDGQSVSRSQDLTASGSGRYLVVFKSGTLPSNAAAIISGAGASIKKAIPEIGVASVTANDGAAAALAKNGAILAVGEEHITLLPDTTVSGADADVDSGPTAADNLYGYQWDMRRIGAPAVWARLPLPTNGKVATVAVLDVGVLDNHRDLDGQVVFSASTSYCSASGGPHNSAGYPIYTSLIDFDQFPSWSPADGCTPAATSYEWHGTHVAGTVAAKFGGGRVVGVDPDARIAAYKVFDHFKFTDADGTHIATGAFDAPLFSAIVDATLRGYPVISMSLGGVGFRNNKGDNASWKAWNRVADFAERNGALLVAAEGNDALNLNGVVTNVPGDIPSIIGVSATGWSELTFSGGLYVPATGSHDVLAFYSNIGSTVSLSAPGGDCGPGYDGVHCVAQYLILSDYVFPDGSAGYVFAAGTSMATPHVSAVAAMVRALHPGWNPSQVRTFLQQTAQDIGSRQAFGHGIIDADAATR
ncbi:MAG: S8 family peptidase [Myxococcales bacterium]